jgi:hypothetical protein
LAATLQLSFLLELVAECHDSWQHDTIGVLPVATQTTTPHLISTELVLSLSLSLSFFCTLAQAVARSAPHHVESTPRRRPLAPVCCCSLLHTPSPIHHFLSSNAVHLFHSPARSSHRSAPASTRSTRRYYCHRCAAPAHAPALRAGAVISRAASTVSRIKHHPPQEARSHRRRAVSARAPPRGPPCLTIIYGRHLVPHARP